MKLSKRLKICLEYTKGFHCLADIGTDHAFLPIHAVQNGYVSKAYACDNKEGPLVIATSNVKRYKLEEKITVIKADGLARLEDDTDVVVISGMGGFLIRQILLKDSLKNVKRFILQPNNDTDKIREILHNIGFQIHEEIVLKERDKYYDILILEPGTIIYSSDEIKYGPILLKTQPHYFVERLNEIKNSLQVQYEKSNREEILDKINEIERVLL